MRTLIREHKHEATHHHHHLLKGIFEGLMHHDRDNRQPFPSIDFTGPIGSGKSTYADALAVHIKKETGQEVPRFSMSAKIMEEAIRRYGTAYKTGTEEKDRILLGNLAMEMAGKDPAYWGKLLIDDIKSDPCNVPFIMDGLRLPSDAETFRKAFPNDFAIIGLDTDPAKRREKNASLSDDELRAPAELYLDGIHSDLKFFNEYDQGAMKGHTSFLFEIMRNGTLHEMLVSSHRN